MLYETPVNVGKPTPIFDSVCLGLLAIRSI